MVTNIVSIYYNSKSVVYFFYFYFSYFYCQNEINKYYISLVLNPMIFVNPMSGSGI